MLAVARLREVEAVSRQFRRYHIHQTDKGEPMDSNRVKGTVDELVGIAKKKTGNLTGSTKLQIEGTAQQMKGKLERCV